MPRTRTYRVELSQDERKLLQNMKRRKDLSSNAKTRLDIILAADENFSKKILTYQEVANKAGASYPTVVNTLKSYCSFGLEKTLEAKRNPNSNTARLKVTGDLEAKIVAKACMKAPDGYVRWTIALLTEACMAILEETMTVSRSTVWRTLKRNDLRPHLSAYWCIPPEEDADFVANMEDILDVYQMPYDPRRPLWCMDEKPYQILSDSREPIPMKPGSVEKIDYEYVRNGTVSIFCMMQPHTGRIEHCVEETRTAVDFAEKIKYLVDEVEPEAEKIILVMDNLNTHKISSLYKAFSPEEARRIARKLEVHYTPKHGSWLDIAEIGINIMTRQCLNRKIPSIEALQSELAAWSEKYNNDPSPVEWQFTTTESRIKLKRLYPDVDKSRKERDERRKAKSKTKSNSADEQTE